jgi:hypothetical protein
VRFCDYCSSGFIAATYNNIYCCAECRRLGTNQKLSEQYHKNKERLANLDGQCLSCKKELSRYNQSGVCFSCQKERESLARKELTLRFG